MNPAPTLEIAYADGRADEREIWERRVEQLTAELRASEARYMALLNAVASGRALQVPTPIVVVQQEQQ